MYFEDKAVDSTSVGDDMLVGNADKHLIDEELFQRIIKICDDIYKVTEVRPTIRKLVNLVIEKADLEAIRDQLVKKYS